MRPRRRDFERALGGRLRLDVGEIHVAGRQFVHQRVGVAVHDTERRTTGEMFADRRERCRAPHRDAVDHGGFGHVRLGEDQLAASHRARRERDRQRTAHRPEVAFESQLAEKERRGKAIVGDLAARGEDADRDREIECAATLLHVGRREIDRDASQRQLEPGVAERGGDALAPFLDGAKWQADRGEGRQPVGDVDLDVDSKRFHAQYGGGSNASEQRHLEGSSPGVCVNVARVVTRSDAGVDRPTHTG